MTPALPVHGAMTRRRALLVLGAAAAALACGGTAASAPAPAAIAYGRDECDYCRMTIDDPALAAQHVGADGRAHRFGEVGCLLAWLAERGADGAAAGGTAFVAVPATAASSDPSWLAASSARYARGIVRTPMRFDLTAHAPGGAAAATLDWARLLREGKPRVSPT